VANKEVSVESVLRHRTVIPKWNAPDKAVERDQPNAEVLKRRKILANTWRQKLLSTYEQSPSASSAYELYELSLMYQGSIEIPNKILKESNELRTQVNSSFSEKIVIEPQLDSLGVEASLEATHLNSRASVGKLKTILRENSDVPFAWSELARHYLVLGEPEKAKKSMQCAIRLARNNRYIQRAATRLFVHLREPDRALHLLRASPMVTKDPWLLSAEIAASTKIDKTSSYISFARNIINSRDVGDYQKSELASALGTLEMENGVTKKAKELFNRSLISPTENSLAQAQWANNQGKIIIPNTAWMTTQSHEALTLAARQDGRWDDVLKECALWLRDEPYSIQAALLGSYFGFRPDTYSTAVQFATAGLLSENNNCDSINIMLLNNRAVALTYQSKLKEAYTDFEKAIALSDSKESAHLLATLGLISYRSGEPDFGAECYLKSIAWFHEVKDKGSALLASVYFLREHIRINREITPLALSMAKKAVASASTYNLPELQALSDLLIQEIENNENETEFSELHAVSLNDLSSHTSKFLIPRKALIRLSADQDPARFLDVWIK
jgi:tetratricopeptide (TPR) repeat protein